jgi:O-methyltransferase involved in polyketide biosynthesis
MKTEKVHLTREKETLLPTLYGKALDSRKPDSILHDTVADEVLHRLDYDFTKLDFPKGGDVSLPVRAKHLDGWTREFIAANPECTVLHLGCGLDSRVCRIDPGPRVRWYDVDHAEVIDLRGRLYPARPGYTMVPTSVTDLRWLEQVASDAPVLLVAEGLVIYLPEAEGLALFRAVTQRFPRGQLAFDAYSPFMLRLTSRLPAVKKSGAVLRWAIGDAQEIPRRVPALELMDAVPFLTSPELIERMARSRTQRWFYQLFDHVPPVRRMVQHLRYRFGDDAPRSPPATAAT